MRAKSTRSPPQRLESLPTSTTDSRSPSLRGSKHSKIPSITNHPLNTLLPTQSDGDKHPQPFYATQTIVVRIGDEKPGWKIANRKQGDKLLDLWNTSDRFRIKFLEELLKDCLHEQINSICSAFLVGANAKRKKDRSLLVWLQENIFEPVLYEQTEQNVYEEIFDVSRTLTESELKQYERAFADKEVDATFLTFLQDHHRRYLNNDEGKTIYNRKWGEVVYHLNKIIGKASLLENYGIRKLKEQFVYQIAGRILLSETLQYMQQETSEWDQSNRIEAPVRKVYQ